MRYGQLVIGGAGSGKTTYCSGLSQLLTQLNRKFVIVNLDAGNILEKSSIDIRELVTVEEIGNSECLGPNGSLLYCMEQILVDFHWLEAKIKALPQETYIVMDCPGQIELFANSEVIRKLSDKLQTHLQLNLVCVNLVDSFLLTDRWHYLSGLLGSLASMLQLELPHINVLSKVDLLKNIKNDMAMSFRSALAAGGEGTGDLRTLLTLEDPQTKKEVQFNALTRNLAEIIDDYGLVGFQPLAVEDKELMIRLLDLCDRSNGFSCNNPSAMILDRSGESREDLLISVEEKYLEDTVLGCGACRNPEAALVCGRCKLVKYCDRECQAEHWKNEHRLNCKKQDQESKP